MRWCWLGIHRWIVLEVGLRLCLECRKRQTRELHFGKPFGKWEDT